MLATGFVIACFATGLSLWVRGGALLTLLAGLLLRQLPHRHVAIAPMALMQFNPMSSARFSPRLRIIIGMVILGITTAGAVGAAWVMRDVRRPQCRLLRPRRLIKPQAQYTPREKRADVGTALYLGRLYRWLSQRQPKNRVLVGFGPDAWVGKFPVYAHNTLVVGRLYQYGIVGVMAMIVLWSWMFIAPCASSTGRKGKLLAAHASFFLLNMATMPHWTHRGEHALRHHLRLYPLSAAGAGHHAGAAPGQQPPCRRSPRSPDPTS